MNKPEYFRIKDIPEGSLIDFGKNKFEGQYKDGVEDISWRIIAKDHNALDSGYPENGITLIADRVIKYMAYDAKEPSNTIRDRQNSGNNRWRTSNIRQWLNASGGANQWYVPQNLGVSGTDNKDTPPKSEYMLNMPRNYPYAEIGGFMNSFSERESEFLLKTVVKTMIPRVSEGGMESLEYENTEDFFYFPSISEMTGQTNGITIEGGGGVSEGSQIEGLNTYRNTRASLLGLENGANYGLNPETDKAYFYRSPSNDSNDVRRFFDGDSISKSSTAKAFNVSGIRPMTNVREDMIVVKTGPISYKFVDNANPHIELTNNKELNVEFTIYEYDDELHSATATLNNEQISSFSVSGKKSADISLDLPYEKMFLGENLLKITATDSYGNKGHMNLKVVMRQESTPDINGQVSTKSGIYNVKSKEVGSNGILTIELDKNILRSIKIGDVVEILENPHIPYMAINDSYNNIPIYREMRLDFVDYNLKTLEATEQWSLVDIGKFAHTKIKMNRKDVNEKSHVSKISQIFTYYDED